MKNLTSDQQIVLELVLDGQMSMSYALAWCERTGQADFAAYLRTF